MKKFKLLKPSEDHPKKPTDGQPYKLQHRKKANLLRDMYPYSEVPKLFFDKQSVQMDPPDDIWITCTTFRDGQQARPPYTTKQIVDLYDFLHRLGGPNGVIRQSEFFLYSKKDREAVEKCLEKGYEFPEVTGWIRAVAADFQLVKQMELKETGILTSVSDYHIFLKLNMTRKQALDRYLGLVKEALSEGVLPRCHFEDLTKSDLYGFIIPFAQELMKLADESKVPIKIRLCDTMGYGVPYPNASLPRGVPKLVHTMVHEAGVPKAQLEWHGHNDFHKVHINGAAAWLYGCAALNASLLGIGERTGNPPLEGACIEYASLTGDTNGMDLSVITEIANYYWENINYHIPSSYPFTGSCFNVTRAGIHADGVIKNEEIYNIFDTDKLLNRPLGVSITDKSGAAGVALWINNYLGLKGEEEVRKNDKRVVGLYRWVMEQYKQKRTTAISSEEMLYQARIHLPARFTSDLDLIKKKAFEMASALEKEVMADKRIASKNIALTERLLRTYAAKYPFMQFLYVVDTDGKQITKNITQKEDTEQFENVSFGIDFADRLWFKGAMENKGIFVSNVYSSTITGKLIITASSTIENRYGKIVGIFGIDLRFEDLAKLVSVDT